jgi:hypothetical protein
MEQGDEEYEGIPLANGVLFMNHRTRLPYLSLLTVMPDR